MSTGAQGKAQPHIPELQKWQLAPPPPQLLSAITPPKITSEKCLPGCARAGGGLGAAPPASASAAAILAG